MLHSMIIISNDNHSNDNHTNGTICNDFQREFHLTRTQVEYGAPKHWKGRWDGIIGSMSQVFETAAKKRYIERIPDVVDVYREWAAQQEDMFHEGPTFHIFEYEPPLKSTCKRAKLIPASVFGIDNSYSWSFTVNDRRAWDRPTFLGSGVHSNVLTAITVRNLTLTGLKGIAEKTGHPCVDEALPLEEDNSDDEAQIMELHTGMFKGWRCSFIKPQENKAAKRRIYLHKQCMHRPAALTKKESMQSKSPEQLVRAHALKAE